MNRAASNLWGSFTLSPGTHGAWRIGPLQMWAEHAAGTWTIHSLVSADPFAEDASFTRVDGPLPALEEGNTLRCTSGSREAVLHVSPALADRPVIVRAERPFTLLPGDETSFFVGSQIWIKLRIGTPPTELADFPSARPSDTWFGPSPREGELCYASRTRTRTDLSDEPIRPARALTQVRLRNSSSEPLVFERLKIPVGHLGLYSGKDGRLWTHGVSVELDRGGVEVECRVDQAPPPSARDQAALEGPRRTGPDLLKRALHALVG